MAISTGVYCVTIGENFYIGGTKNFDIRIRSHYNLLKNNKHNNKHMQNAFNKHGYIEAELIEQCDIDTISQKEQQYIDQWFGDNRCMNFLKVAVVAHGHTFNEDVRKKMSEAAKRRDPSTRSRYKRTEETKEKIRQANSKITWEDAAEIRQMFSKGVRQKEIGKIFGIDSSTVSNVITSKRWKVGN
jgi:group I intron endonuclease